MTPRTGLYVALVGLVIAVFFLVPALPMPDAEAGGVSDIVMLCILGAGIGLTVMVAGLAIAARAGMYVALLGLVTMLLCSLIIFLLMLFFDAASRGTRTPPIVSLFIVALSIGGGNVGCIVMLVGLAMAGVRAVKKLRVKPS
jgi:hypothetical protein